MKQKLKKLKLLFAIILAGFLLFSCQKDAYDDAIYQSQFKVSHKKFEDLINQPKFSKAISKVKGDIKNITLSTNNTVGSRTIMENQYNFTISDKLVNVIEKDTLTSYTLFITRDDTPTNVFENLVVQVNNQNQTHAFILKYTSDTDINQSDFNVRDFKGQKTITPIVYNPAQASLTVYNEDCFDVSSWYCYGPGHHSSSDGCTKGYLITSQVCSGSPSDGISTGSGIGEILTAPQGAGGGSTQTTFPDTPCGRLQKGTSSDKYKQNFKSLNKPEKFNLSYETGFVKKVTNGVLGYSFLQAPDANSLNIPSGSLNYTHVHNNNLVTDLNGDTYDGTAKILSPKDVLALITNCQNAAVAANTNPTEAFGIMISDESIFAITLLNPLSPAELGQLNSKWKKIKDKYTEKADVIIKNPNLDTNSRKIALQKMFLTLLKDAELENKVGLFEGEAQDNIDTYDIIWTRKSLNPTNPKADPIETPC